MPTAFLIVKSNCKEFRDKLYLISLRESTSYGILTITMNNAKRIEINDYIVADPKICHGKPTFKGTRIMVWQILEMLKAGEKTQDIIKTFPSITPKFIEAALFSQVNFFF